MRFPLIAALAVAGCAGLLALSQLVAQRSATSQSPVALVDMASLTRNSARLNQAMDGLKKEYQAKEEELKKEGERGNLLTEEARKLPPSSQEFKELEKKLMKMRADYELHGKRVTNDIRENETQIILGLIRELQGELASYSKATGVPLILRYDSTPAELTDPQAILREIQKPIVYQSGLEITPAVLETMNRRVPGGSTATKAPAKGVRK